MDNLLEKFLGLSSLDNYNTSVSASIELSLERLLESRVSELYQDQLIENTLKMGSILLEVGKRAQRNRFSKHNSVCWALSHDLTIKVFAMLDTQSLCSAAATCWMFNKCAMNPLCYADIDLTTVVPRVNNAVVATMIHRAGKRLRSLKLGVLSSPTTFSGNSGPMVYGIDSSVDAGFSRNNKRSCQGKDSYVLSRSCLTFLSLDGGASGALLKKLHLYNVDKMDNTALRVALSVCQALTDFKIVGLVTELKQTLESVSTTCPNLECLLIESYKTGRDDSLKSTTCVGFVNSCPRLTSLALRGFILQDYKIRILMKGFRKLKFVDLSTSYSITGTFLRNLGTGTSGHQLEVLILRECMHLKEVEVGRLLTAVLSGGFKFLKHLDISNKEGLASDHDWYDRCYSPSIPVKRVMEERPGLCLVAVFPPEGSFMDTEQISESEVNSDANLDLERTGATSDSSLSMFSSESSYNSDQGNDLYASSDEVDFLGA
ncbi:F-box protein At4g02760-like [Papaver somniferum]|uniref:F-box protein At4g02760-like n=1 Tax=Papaver somniferum TaxID=3469 RepID=UPI000E6FFABE|nr:F-box protein At4g02760-like [Papaver somniferum]